MIVALDGIARARMLLSGGRHSLGGGFVALAARDAYLAAFNAAWAYVVHRTGRRPKTHAGTRSEFARLIHATGDLPDEFRALLARGYERKTHADYGEGTPATREDAESALADAERMVAAMERLLLAEDNQSA